MFHCQLAHGSATIDVKDFSNVKELYGKIAEAFRISVSEVSLTGHMAIQLQYPTVVALCVADAVTVSVCPIVFTYRSESLTLCAYKHV